MRKSQLMQAVAMAKDMSIPLPEVGVHLWGCCLSDFSRTFSKIEDVAKLIRENCICFDGTFLPEELNSLWVRAFKNKVEII